MSGPIRLQESGGLIKSAQKGIVTVPQNALEPLFTVTGKILVLSLVAEVTTQLGAGPMSSKFVANPTVGADVDLCAAADTAVDTVGTIYSVSGDFSDNILVSTSGALEITSTANSREFIVTAGTIDFHDNDAAATGAIKASIVYIPIDEGARVEAA